MAEPVRVSYLQGRGEGGPLDGVLFGLETPMLMEPFVRTIEVFLSPSPEDVIAGDKWSGYIYGQRPEDLLVEIRGHLTHRELAQPPVFPAGDRAAWAVELINPRGPIRGGPLEGRTMLVEAVVAGERVMLFYALVGEGRDQALWHAHIYSPGTGTWDHMGAISGDPAPDSKRV